MLPLHQKHYSSLCLNESMGVSHHHGIHLGTGHRLTVFADMELASVDDVRYLLCLQATITLG